MQPVVRTRLHEQVADQIAALIVSRQYQPGDLLPTERELGARFQVSRTVVREAIRVLTTKGLVEARQGHGARVRPQNADRVAEALRLLLQMRNGSAAAVLEARRVIEPGIAALAADRATSDDDTALRAAVDDLGAAIAQCDPASKLEDSQLDALIAADAAFHLGLVRASRNEVLISLLEALRDPIFLVRRISFHASERLTNTLAAHRAILDAVVARDPPRASEEMVRHLDEVIGDVRHVEARLGTPILAFDPSTLPATER
jgi:GntR family transcriptional regulator, transcriptional repressor for pyruvate dehydrogenase complex